ncbi:GntP family permease [Bifidobacterium sp. SMB2]|uniref:GntP family permease n=1 Tax=Bifidobacterium saimiriisciurei TaxID=2661627 RepID=A0ABX0CEF6_9BIFI|nr:MULTISPECIES: SLC13 family permease [Bifidobacterium]NEG95453.1 GntP family permease [Bifidobacterium sp. SMB2]NEH12190.1 GntP family permease [Bifidobacterium saimiriisciurei]
MVEGVSIAWWAALAGLAVAIVLILRKLNATYALLLGAVVGCLIGGASLAQTVNVVVAGGQSVVGTIVRVLAAGVLAGVMMESGAADRIAKTIVAKFGESLAIFSLAFATMIICAVGVFIPVAVLIVAPIALEVGNRLGISKLALLVALSGGGKAGNIISPNPNTIAAASGFGIQPSAVMVGSFIPAVCGLAMAVLLATLLRNHGAAPTLAEAGGGNANGDSEAEDSAESARELPTIGRALVAPVIAIVLLLVNPIGSVLGIGLLAKFQVDAMYILPFAAVIGLFVMGQGRHLLDYTKAGLARMTDVVLILIGAGAIGGLITNSDLSTQIVNLIKAWGVSGSLLAPLAGILMAAATASTSTGVILGSSSFGSSILDFGVTPVAAAVTMQAGATVIDHLPHGNYFHVSGQAMKMTVGERMKSVPFESIVGLTMTIVATLVYTLF